MVSWTALSFSWLSWRLTSKKSFDKTVKSCSNLHDVTCLIFWALSDGNEKNKNLYCSVRKSKENLRLLARQRVNRIETYVTSFMDPLRHFFPHSFIASLQYFFCLLQNDLSYFSTVIRCGLAMQICQSRRRSELNEKWSTFWFGFNKITFTCKLIKCNSMKFHQLVNESNVIIEITFTCNLINQIQFSEIPQTCK